MTEHRYTVAHNEDTPVADHFTKADGDIRHKMRVAVLAPAPDNTRTHNRENEDKPALTVINRDDRVDILNL